MINRKDYYEICKEASAKERAYMSVIDENRRQVRIIEHLKKKGVPCCVVCMDADAKVSFVHGNSAHLATCEACAAKHFRRYDQIYINDSDTDDDDNVRTEKCPVCRQRIELIVKQF